MWFLTLAAEVAAPSQASAQRAVERSEGEETDRERNPSDPHRTPDEPQHDQCSEPAPHPQTGMMTGPSMRVSSTTSPVEASYSATSLDTSVM